MITAVDIFWKEDIVTFKYIGFGIEMGNFCIFPVLNDFKLTFWENFKVNNEFSHLRIIVSCYQFIFHLYDQRGY